ncbi:hypothetical protein [Nocardioides convexus]|uniref:hypothetical protein n=1 Tax=Nocardioides convexus TaxID=2712224 RepID=UPI00241870FF|nr:hypothetical protein [Nocardioides convexus]
MGLLGPQVGKALRPDRRPSDRDPGLDRDGGAALRDEPDRCRDAVRDHPGPAHRPDDQPGDHLHAGVHHRPGGPVAASCTRTADSLLGTLQQVSGAIGTALLIVIMTNRGKHLAEGGASQGDAFVGGLQWAFATGAVIGLVVVAMALLLPSKADAPAAHH